MDIQWSQWQYGAIANTGRKRAIPCAAHSDFEAAENAAKSNICLQLTGKGQTLKWRSEKPCVIMPVRSLRQIRLLRQSRRHPFSVLIARQASSCLPNGLSGSVWSTPFVHRDHLYVTAKDGLTTIFAIASRCQQSSHAIIFGIRRIRQNRKPTSKLLVATVMASRERPRVAVQLQKKERRRLTARGREEETWWCRRRICRMLLQNDKNKDGKITKDELPEAMLRMLALGDKNKDDALDQSEIAAMSEEFRKRRETQRRKAETPIL